MRFTAFIAYDLIKRPVQPLFGLPRTRGMDKLCVMHDVAPVLTKCIDTLGGCHDRQGKPDSFK